MRRLIVNADGFGFTEGVNRGIVEAVEGGLVHSTSCVVNFPRDRVAPAFAAHWPHVSPGVHFNLSVGRPVCDPGQVLGRSSTAKARRRAHGCRAGC